MRDKHGVSHTHLHLLILGYVRESAHTPGLAKVQWHRVGWVDGCLYLVLHTVFLSISSWKDAPAFVPDLVRDVLQQAKTMTNSGP